MPTFDDWSYRYHKTVRDILQKELDVCNTVQTTYFDRQQDPEWSALIYIQENVNSFSFNEWLKYVDYVVNLIVEKDSSEIEDLPYYDLWNKAMNPLIVALYAIFHSSETLDDTDLPMDARDIWEKSKYSKDVRDQIDYILTHL